jgi:hypothetical protein
MACTEDSPEEEELAHLSAQAEALEEYVVISRRYLVLGLRSQNANDLPLVGYSAVPGV